MAEKNVTCKGPSRYENPVIDSYKKIHADILAKIPELKSVFDVTIDYSDESGPHPTGIEAFESAGIAGTFHYLNSKGLESEFDLTGTDLEAARAKVNDYDNDAKVYEIPQFLRNAKSSRYKVCEFLIPYGRILARIQATIPSKTEEAAARKKGIRLYLLNQVAGTVSDMAGVSAGLSDILNTLTKREYGVCFGNSIYKDAVIKAYKAIHAETRTYITTIKEDVDNEINDESNLNQPTQETA